MLDMRAVDLSINGIIEKVKPVVTNNYYIIYFHHLFVGVNEEWSGVKIKDLKPYFAFEQVTEDKDGDKDTLTARRYLECL